MDPDFTSWTIATSKGQKQQIGEGEFGTIFKARTDRNQTVAVKIVCIKVVGNSTLSDSKIHEEKLVFENLRKIRHPNVVQFLKFESSPSEMKVCIITEIISGDSLWELMAEQKKPFEEPRVREFSLQICSALNFLHSRKPVVLHRDIKCSNIMLTNEGVIKLIDFGFAKEIAKTASPSQTESPEGCLYFMAPELFTVESQGVPTPRCTIKTDVWAFGCTIFQMLNMQPPYQDVPRSEIPQTVAQSDTPQLPGVSDSLHEFYNRCLVKNPEDRADTSELLQTRLLKRSASDVDSTALDEKFIEWSFIFNDNGKKELVGEGEFIKVYKAFTDKHQTVAVKVRKNFRTLDRQGNPHMEGIFETLRSGYQILKKIRHRNILLFLKFERTAKHGFCIFTELIAGRSLAELMNRQRRPFDEAGVKKFSLQICSALHYLHSRKPTILHRNLNCSNIMLTDQGDIKLISFSNALECPGPDCVQEDCLKTSPFFMAPELFSQHDRVVHTPKTDVWAFGCTVFEMLTTRPPNRELMKQQIAMRIKKSNMPQLPDATSHYLSDFYHRCVLREPNERANTAELLRHRFLQNYDQEPLDPDFTSWNIVRNDDGSKLLIGRGAFGDVFKAITDRQQTVAVKIVRLHGLNSLEEIIEQENAEISILKSVRHPNIVLFLKSECTGDNEFCIFTELIEGHNLLHFMEIQKRPFSETEVQNISLQICSVLNFLHSRRPAILHRDIKCSNIMINKERTIKLIDFGLAREIITTSKGHISDNQSGTWHFMAPEILGAEDQVVYTKKTDVWAFGCTVFEMLTMKPPNDNLKWMHIPLRVTSQKLPDLPTSASKSLQKFYRRCVKQNPLERADTAQLLEHSFLTSGRDSLSYKFTSWSFIFDDDGKRQLVGEGEFGKVFKALTDMHQAVAVKVIRNNEQVNIESWENTVETVRSGHEVLQGIRHRNILLFLKSEITAEHGFCIFTELIAGQSLSVLMTRQRKPLDESAIIKLSRQICSALNYLHTRKPAVLHRNIKGSNIMLNDQGEFKLIGFGLAVECSGSEFKDKIPRGTWHFMAPELCGAHEDYDAVYNAKTDVWAFGCTIFQMLEMKPPNFELEAHLVPMKILVHDLPNLPAVASECLSEFYRRCVARNPEERADSAELLQHKFLQQN